MERHLEKTLIRNIFFSKKYKYFQNGLQSPVKLGAEFYILMHKTKVQFFFDSTILLMESWGRENICFVTITKSKQGNEQTRSFEPANESAIAGLPHTVIISLSE